MLTSTADVPTIQVMFCVNFQLYTLINKQEYHHGAKGVHGEMAVYPRLA
jgi:hypothetical protein